MVTIFFFTEHAESSQCHSEADSSCPPSWAVQKEPGARHSELQGGGPETEEDHLPAGEGERSLHQWGQRSHAKGMQLYTQWQKKIIQSSCFLNNIQYWLR